VVLAFLIGSTCYALGQSHKASVRGEVRDERGDAIVGARVALTQNAQSRQQTVTNEQGHFEFHEIAAGSYVVEVSTDGFGIYRQDVSVHSAEPVAVSVVLRPTVSATITVEAPRVSLDPQEAGGSQILKGRQIADLPDDPDQLMDRLQLMATSSGSPPGEATVSVDGFLNDGRLPPKSAIREVRINPDLFSSEYDKAPYRGGRIEIITKPGAGGVHGSGFFTLNTSALSARNPFAASKPQSTTERFGGQIGGPVVKRKSGFFVDFESRNINQFGTVDAITLDPTTFGPTQFVASVPAPRRLVIASARFDWQVTPSTSAVLRYDFDEDRAENLGVGGFDLPDRAFNSDGIDNSLKLSSTSIVGQRLVNEARLGITLRQIGVRSLSNSPDISVLGFFSTGGATRQSESDRAWLIELADNVSIPRGKHSLKLGLDLFDRRIYDASFDNTNGTFIFGGGLLPELDSRGRIVTGPGGKPVLINASGLEQYRRALLGLPGRTASSFAILQGRPGARIDQVRLAAFTQDEWKLAPNLLISMGLRFEGQTRPSGWSSFAPRLGVAYSLGPQRRWVFRARAGMFYDRISELLPIQALELDGIRSMQIRIQSPPFPNPFAAGATQPTSTIRSIESDIGPPASLQVQAGFERALPHGWKLEANDNWAWGWSSLTSMNINAPVIIAGPPEEVGPRPLGVNQDILQFQSAGKTRGSVLFVGMNQSTNKRFSLYSGYLMFNFRSTSDGAFSFPQYSYGFAGEWARPSWQARHRAFIAGNIDVPLGLRLSSSVSIASGAPYNITTGRDANGDGIFNDRPALVAGGTPGSIKTAFGLLDPSAINGNLPRNAGTGRPTATVDLNLSKTFKLRGKADGEGGANLILNVRAANALNHTNVLGTNGVVSSPFFGTANSAGTPRLIELGARFSF
jgi:hypothetical protein